MSTTADYQVLEVNMDEIKKLAQRAREGPLSQEECDLIQALAESYINLRDEIGDKKASIDRLRQLVFGAKTESRKNVRKMTGTAHSEGQEEGQEKEKRKGHGRMPAESYTGVEKIEVAHESLSSGDPCPHACCKGRVYDKDPRVLIRIKGGPPFRGTAYRQACLRCNLCGEVFLATLPEGVGEKKYDETVPSMAAVLRYGSGVPMARIEEMQKASGVPLPASVQWELMEEAAEKIKPAHNELICQGAQGVLLLNDDTPMKILDFLVDLEKRKECGEPLPERTGTFTSGIVSELPDGHQAVLYFTGQKHAGENLTAVLAKRSSELDPPVQMCDGLKHNVPTEMKTILSNCLAHARRQFVDVASSFPQDVEHVIDELAIVYKNDSDAKKSGMSAEERLRFHQEASGPVMDRLKEWMKDLVDKKKVEPNSGLGKAITYCQNRWEPLTLFLKVAGAPLDNSLTERMLKRAVLHRKNSLFYKTANGAQVGDLYMSLIATAKLAKANPFDYLTELQRHAEEVEENPAGWLPWNYRETLAHLPPRK